MELTAAQISEIFPMDEVASQTESKDVEIYGRTMGTLYVRRFHSKDFPKLTAYLVIIFHDGTRDELTTNDPEEITAWTNLYR